MGELNERINKTQFKWREYAFLTHLPEQSIAWAEPQEATTVKMDARQPFLDGKANELQLL